MNTFVVVFLLTIVWLPSGTPISSIIRQRDVAHCHKAADSFELGEAMVNSQRPPGLMESWTSSCEVRVSHGITKAVP